MHHTTTPGKQCHVYFISTFYPDSRGLGRNSVTVYDRGVFESILVTNRKGESFLIVYRVIFQAFLKKWRDYDNIPYLALFFYKHQQ